MHIYNAYLSSINWASQCKNNKNYVLSEMFAFSPHANIRLLSIMVLENLY